MTSAHEALLEHYAEIDKVMHPREVPELGALVSPSGNSEEPIHRWFHQKEAFSSKLLGDVLERVGMATAGGFRLLDPFAGVGTSVLAAIQGCGNGQWPSIEAIGIERNPFLQLVANTKVQAALKGTETFDEFVARLGKGRWRLRKSAPVSKLSTFHNRRFFSPEAIIALATIRSWIEDTPGSNLDKDLARVCLAATVEPASHLRKDGRALRFEENREPQDVHQEFRSRCQIVIQDLQQLAEPKGQGTVSLGDGRSSSTLVPGDKPFDLILFSPPYPNNIDYTEVYKLEAWCLGMYTNAEDVKSQRLLTVRSHPSIRFPDIYEISSNGYKKSFDATIGPLRRVIPEDRYSRGRHQLVRGYFDDMLQTFADLYKRVADNGAVVYVVANSLHGSGKGSMLIAADLLMAELAQSVGFRVEDFMVARRPVRRGKNFDQLRESVVVLKKVEVQHHA